MDNILIINCFHWIGYHIADSLLEQGRSVDGMDCIDSKQKDHLSMFFGRNDLFSMINQHDLSQHDTVIIVGNASVLPNILAERKIIIDNRIHLHAPDCISIAIPFLIGEWMPMNEKGVYVDGNMIPLESELLRTEAVYVRDFTEILLQWLHIMVLPKKIEVRSRNSQQNRLENSMHILNNRPKGEMIKRLKAHYRKNKYVYDTLPL